MKELRIGIQMYTIREALARDFKGTCRELVKLGCDGVEMCMDFGGMTPEECSGFFKEIGLRVCGLHLSGKEVLAGNPSGLDYAAILNIPYLTCSKGGDFTQVLDECITMCRNGGRIAARTGRVFTYHNHAAEFVRIDGSYALDLIYAATDPELVMAEPDVYWIAKGGEDPVAYIARYAQRMPQLHLKDMSAETGSFTELGRGVIDLPGCVEVARNSICRWVIYEQDQCEGDAFESAVISIEYLKKLLGR